MSPEPMSPDVVREWRGDFVPVYLSNGLLGLRAIGAPPLGGVAMVNSFASRDPGAEVAAQLPIPYLLAADVVADDVPMTSVPVAGLLREQRYDFGRGELHSRLAFAAHDTSVVVDVLTLCNRSMPTIAMQELTVRVDRECRLRLSAGLDPSLAPGSSYESHLGSDGHALEPAHGAVGWRTPDDVSRCGIAYVAELDGAAGCAPQFRHNVVGQMTTAYEIQAEPGRTYRLRQLTCVVPDSLHASPHLHAVRLLADAHDRGFAALLAANAREWEQLWCGRVELIGAPSRWQALTDAAFFYLHTSVHPSSPASTSPFGMGYWPDYHYYRGHVMWDIESFAVPPLLLTQPDAARALLAYRCSHLGGAISNALANGYAGAQFPWESSPREGLEASPLGVTAPMAEHHVSMDVALALARFVHATGELEFARSAAWPVLAEVARWIASRVIRTMRGYEICRVTGVAETGGAVDNNAYVNMAAATALREAVGMAAALGVRADPAWTSIADGLVLARGSDGAILNHDGYQPGEPHGGTPEAAAGLFPVGYAVDAETERTTFVAAVDRCEDYVGSPMLSALLGVYAARLGRRDKALELYERGFADFVLAPHSITTEFSPAVFPDQPRGVPFAANVGGFLTGCIYGLTGMHLTGGDVAGWTARPVTMPAGWDGITIERLWVRGRPATLTAEHGDGKARLDLR